MLKSALKFGYAPFSDMKIDLYKHVREGRRLFAVESGVDPQAHEMTLPEHELRAARLYRRGLQLGTAQQPVFDHVRVRADIERQGWAKIILQGQT